MYYMESYYLVFTKGFQHISLYYLALQFEKLNMSWVFSFDFALEYATIQVFGFTIMVHKQDSLMGSWV